MDLRYCINNASLLYTGASISIHYYRCLCEMLYILWFTIRDSLVQLYLTKTHRKETVALLTVMQYINWLLIINPLQKDSATLKVFSQILSIVSA